MASEGKQTKSETAPKKDATAKVASTAAEAAPKDAAKDAPKSGGGETAGTAPASYSRGEGQKPVTAAYKENWNAIFANKKNTKKRAKKKKR
jgi:hypothetical protein